MNFISTLVTFFIGLTVVHGWDLKVNIRALAEAERRGIIDEVVNSTIESARRQLMEYDPYNQKDISNSIPGLGDFSISSVTLSGFSNYAFTSLSVSIIRSKLEGILRYPDFIVSLAGFELSSSLINLDISFETLSVGVSGMTFYIDTTYDLREPELTSLSLLIQIEGIRGSIIGSINNQTVEINLTPLSDTLANIANSIYSQHQEEISAGVLTAINRSLKLSPPIDQDPFPRDFE